MSMDAGAARRERHAIWIADRVMQSTSHQLVMASEDFPQPYAVLAMVALLTVAGIRAMMVRGASMPTIGSTASLDNLAFTLLAAVSFMVLASALAQCRYTRKLGQLFSDRLLCTADNWERETLRSFVEFGTWLCVCWSTANSAGSWLLGCCCATVAGCVVILCGEWLTRVCARLQGWLRSWCGERDCGAAASDLYGLASGLVLLLSVYGHGVLTLIYEHVSDLLLACFLAGLAGFALLTIANLVAAWPPTRRAGRLLQARVAPYQTALNWRAHPLRSAIEFCTFLGTTLGVYSARRSLVHAVQAGTLAGILVVLAGEYATCSATSEGRAIERIAGAASPRARGARGQGERTSTSPPRPHRSPSSEWLAPLSPSRVASVVRAIRRFPSHGQRLDDRGGDVASRSLLQLPSDLTQCVLERCDVETLRVAKAGCTWLRANCRDALTARLKAEAGKDWEIVREVSEAESSWTASLEASLEAAAKERQEAAVTAPASVGARCRDETWAAGPGGQLEDRLAQLFTERPVACLAALDSWDGGLASHALSAPPVQRAIMSLLEKPDGLFCLLEGFRKWRDMGEVATVLEAQLEAWHLRRLDVFITSLRWPSMGKAARLAHALYHRDSEFRHTVTGLNNRMQHEVRHGRLDPSAHLEFVIHMGQCMSEGPGTWLGDLVAWVCVLIYFVTSGASRIARILTAKRARRRRW